MRRIRTAVLVPAVILAALPALASVRPMSLHEYMSITDEVLHGHIVAKETFRSDEPLPGTVYTRLLIEGDELRTGRPVETEVVFMGSHDPADDFVHSEAPELRDVRLGNEVVVFSRYDERIADGARRGAAYVDSHQGVYRIERGFGEAVVIGKGDGFAFPENVRLDAVVSRVGETHRRILAERAAVPPAGK